MKISSCLEHYFSPSKKKTCIKFLLKELGCLFQFCFLLNWIRNRHSNPPFVKKKGKKRRIPHIPYGAFNTLWKGLDALNLTKSGIPLYYFKYKYCDIALDTLLAVKIMSPIWFLFTLFLKKKISMILALSVGVSLWVPVSCCQMLHFP